MPVTVAGESFSGPLAGLALFTTLFSPELGLWVGTFHHVIVVRQNTVQLDDSQE
jgi:hypothetical protein